MRKITKKVRGVIDAASTTIADLTNVLDALVERSQAYSEARSEAWTESPQGMAYETWSNLIEEAAQTAEELLDQLNMIEDTPGE